MKTKKELVNKDWKQELVKLLGKSLSLKRASIVVERASLQVIHYEQLCNHLKLFCQHLVIQFPWQLELLTGEAYYVLKHISKKDKSGYGAEHYAVVAGAGATILDKIKTNSQDRFETGNPEIRDSLASLLELAIRFENKAALQWLIKEMPGMKEGHIFNADCKIALDMSNWTEGLEILAECNSLFLERISLKMNQLHKSPKIYKILRENKQFPFAQLREISIVDAVFNSQWEHEVPLLDWCKSNIPDFITLLKEARCQSGQYNILQYILNWRTIEDKSIKQFCWIAKEIPELIHEKDDHGQGLVWFSLSGMKKPPNYDLIKIILPLTKEPDVLDGIYINDELASDSSSSHGSNTEEENYNDEIEDSFTLLNEALCEISTIRGLRFTEDTQTRVQTYIKETGEIPAFFYPLIRNNVLFCLFNLTDTKSVFSFLPSDIIGIIASKLIETIVRDPVVLSTSLSNSFLKNFDTQRFFEKYRPLASPSEEENTLTQLCLN